MCVLCVCGSTKILLGWIDGHWTPAAESPGSQVCAERTIREKNGVEPELEKGWNREGIGAAARYAVSCSVTVMLLWDSPRKTRLPRHSVGVIVKCKNFSSTAGRCFFSACCMMKVFCILGATVCLLIQWQSFVPAPGIDHTEPSANGFLSVILFYFSINL